MRLNDVRLHIYKTTIDNENSSLHGMYYIGQRRIEYDKKYQQEYFGSGHIISKYIRKHGTVGLRKEILEYADNQEDLNALEAKWIGTSFLDDDNCLNLKAGGNQPGYDPEVLERISATLKTFFANDENRKRLSEKVKEAMKRPDVRQRYEEGIRKATATDEWKLHHSEGLKRYFSNEENRARQSTRLKERFSDPELRARIRKSCKAVITEEWRKEQSERITEVWKNPEYREKVLKSRKKRIELEKNIKPGEEGYDAIQEKKKRIHCEKSKFFSELPRTAEWKANISKSLKGRHLSEENKRRVSTTLSGRILPEEHRKHIGEAQRGLRWWNDGKVNKKSAVCPGEGWIAGRVKRRKNIDVK